MNGLLWWAFAAPGVFAPGAVVLVVVLVDAAGAACAAYAADPLPTSTAATPALTATFFNIVTPWTDCLVLTSLIVTGVDVANDREMFGLREFRGEVCRVNPAHWRPW